MAPLREILHLCLILDPPEVEVKKISPVSKEKEGDEMILECVVKRSNPYPFRYRWYKNNTDLTHSGSRYRKTLEQRDNGFYACAADNSAGSSRSSQPVKIHVQCECQTFSSCIFVTVWQHNTLKQL